MNRLWLLLAACLLIIACGGGGGGGGGGGTGTSFPLSGRVLWIENGGATVPASTVRVPGNSDSVVTDSADGSFSINAPQGTTSLTVTYSGTGAPVVRTFVIPTVSAATDLGDLYIGPETTSVTGRVIDAQTSAGVSGAVVKLGGITSTSNATGNFTLAGVAYSSSSLAVFLGLQGEVTASGYFTQFFSPPGASIGGVVNVGNVALTPQGSTNPPPLPYNISGAAAPTATGANAVAELLSGASVIRTTSTDASGKFVFWAPVGTYTARVTKGAQVASSPVTVTSTNQIVNVNVVFP